MKEPDGRRRLSFKRADIILIVCSLGLAAALLAAGALLYPEEQTGLKVRAYTDGTVCLDCAISEDIRTTIKGSDGGENTIVIDDGCVYVDSADCPGQDCVHMGRISKAGEEIICLPHRLVIRIEGGADTVDVMVR